MWRQCALKILRCLVWSSCYCKVNQNIYSLSSILFIWFRADIHTLHTFKFRQSGIRAFLRSVIRLCSYKVVSEYFFRVELDYVSIQSGITFIYILLYELISLFFLSLFHKRFDWVWNRPWRRRKAIRKERVLFPWKSPQLRIFFRVLFLFIIVSFHFYCLPF